MPITLLRPDQLTPDLRERWRLIHEGSAVLQSPYFHPSWTLTASRFRPNVEIGVIDTNGEASGFFPFERMGNSVAGPVAGNLSDYEGIVANAGVRIDSTELLKSCGLKSWDFHHLPADQSSYANEITAVHGSPHIDLQGGFGAYCEEKAHLVKKLRYQELQAEKALGPLRFEWMSGSAADLQTALMWKSAQYLRTGGNDLFRLPWARSLLNALHAIRDDDFGGILSMLYAGNSPIAGHFGMRSRTVLHYWFPAYDLAASRFSPGLILLMRMCSAAPSQGIRFIDLGGGEQPYKLRFANGATPLVAGSLELSRLRRLRKQVGRGLDAWLDASPVPQPAKRVARRSISLIRRGLALARARG